MTRQVIEEKIQLAISKAATSEDIYQYIDQEKKLMQDYLANQLSVEELFDKLHKLEKGQPSVYLYSTEEYQYAADFLGFTPQQIQNCFQQDSDQYQHTPENNLAQRIGLIFYRTVDNRLAMYTISQENLTRTMKAELRRVALKRADLLEQAKENQLHI